MKGINFYALVVTLALAGVIILYARSCKTAPPIVIQENKAQYDSVVKANEVASQVIAAQHEKYSKDSAVFEGKIAVLQGARRSSASEVVSLKKKVTEYSKKYSESENDPVLQKLYCDSLKEENEILAGAFEQQLYVTDSIVRLQEQEIDSLRGVVEAQKNFRSEFLKADAFKDEKYNALYNNYGQLYKKHTSWWNRVGEKVVYVGLGAVGGFVAGKNMK